MRIKVTLEVEDAGGVPVGKFVQCVPNISVRDLSHPLNTPSAERAVENVLQNLSLTVESVLRHSQDVVDSTVRKEYTTR